MRHCILDFVAEISGKNSMICMYYFCFANAFKAHFSNLEGILKVTQLYCFPTMAYLGSSFPEFVHKCTQGPPAECLNPRRQGFKIKLHIRAFFTTINLSVSTNEWQGQLG